MLSRGLQSRERPHLAAACSVLVLAAALLLASAPLAAAQARVTPARVDGSTRFHTAGRIATLTFETAEVAHLVTGRNFPDALAGSFAAGSVDGPLLLATRDHVPGPTWEALDTLGVEAVAVIGGTEAIGASVMRQLDEAGYATERIRGTNRYETAAAVALRYGRERVGTVAGERAAFLATGAHFADALAAGPIAARERLPLLLTPHDRTEPRTDQALDELGIEKIFLLGGPQAISEGVEQSYRDQGYAVERIGGPTLMDTAWVLADDAVHDFGFTHEQVLLARGDDYPDALAASIHGARRGAPIVLSATATELSEPTRDGFARACPAVRAIRALGGTSAISTPVLEAAVTAAESCDGAAPREAAAVTADGRAVVLDAETGTVRRELLDDVRTDDPAKNAVAVTPGQTHVYLTLPPATAEEGQQIVRVPFAGGEPETVVADGFAPAVSPDGQTLAYGVLAETGQGLPEPRLVLRDIASGEERHLAGRDDPFHSIADIEWTADGTALALTVGEIHTRVHLIDRHATSMEQTRRLGPDEERGADASWRETAAIDDQLAVVESCCDPPDEERWHIIEVDPADGAVHGRVVAEERIVATHLDSDADATGLLIVEGGGPEGGALLRWEGSGDPAHVAGEIIAAAW